MYFTVRSENLDLGRRLDLSSHLLILSASAGDYAAASRQPVAPSMRIVPATAWVRSSAAEPKSSTDSILAFQDSDLERSS